MIILINGQNIKVGADWLIFQLRKMKKIKYLERTSGQVFSEALKEIMKITEAEIGDSVFMSCSKEDEIYEIMSKARTNSEKN